MTPHEIISAVHRLGVVLAVVDGRLKASPPGLLPPELRSAIRERVAEVKALIEPTAEALMTLNRLKTFTVLSGRMDPAREIAERCDLRLSRRGEDGSNDPCLILAVLRNIERELTELGAEPDPELAEALGIIEVAFPSARLVEIRRKEPLQ